MLQARSKASPQHCLSLEEDQFYFEWLHEAHDDLGTALGAQCRLKFPEGCTDRASTAEIYEMQFAQRDTLDSIRVARSVVDHTAKAKAWSKFCSLLACIFSPVRPP